MTIPYGDWIKPVAGLLAELMLPLLLALLARLLAILPGPIAGFLTMMRVEQLLGRAIDYGRAEVLRETEGKTITIDVWDRVVARTLQYAIDHGGKLVAQAGGAELLRQKIIARLDPPDPPEPLEPTDLVPRQVVPASDLR